jgi:DNA-directed RNA polymerase specialized sigma24 family protein
MTTEQFFQLIQKDFDYLTMISRKFASNERDAEDLLQETIYKALKSNKSHFFRSDKIAKISRLINLHSFFSASTIVPS